MTVPAQNLDDAILKAVNDLKGQIPAAEKIAELDVAVTKDLPSVITDLKTYRLQQEQLKDELAALPEKLRGDFANYIALTPNAEKQRETNAGEWLDISKMSDEQFGVNLTGESRPLFQEGAAFRKSFLSPAELIDIRRKAITSQDDVPGYGVQRGLLWHDAIPGDAYMSAGSFQMGLSEPAFKTVQVSDIEFAADSSVSHTSLDTTKGSLSASTHTVNNYGVRIVVPNSQSDDLPATLSFIEQMLYLAYGSYRGSATRDVVVAGVDDTNNTTKTGGASTAITESNAVEKLLSLTTKNNLAKYWTQMPGFILHPTDAMTLFRALLKLGTVLSPTQGQLQLAQFPITVDPQAPANATTGKFPDFFGSWGAAVIQAQRGRLTIDRYMQSMPGAVVIYACFRFVPVAVNNDAYSQIKVAA